MGKEFVVTSLEEMCDLMCNNILPNEKEYTHCLRCGRKLKNEKARQIGYGVVCERKMRKENKTQKLF